MPGVGTVADLADGTVAKVWSGRGPADLEVLREFYDAVFERRPGTSTVAMPHLLDLLDVEGTTVTVEQRLSGDPVWRADGTSPEPTASQVDAMVEALAALADIPGDPAFRALPMLPDEPPELDAVLAETVAALHGLHPAISTLIHGDLIGGNVLTSGTHATAVLDFGFMSTAGDPAFDAALAASIFDMWGPAPERSSMSWIGPSCRPSPTITADTGSIAPPMASRRRAATERTSQTALRPVRGHARSA